MLPETKLVNNQEMELIILMDIHLLEDLKPTYSTTLTTIQFQ